MVSEHSHWMVLSNPGEEQRVLAKDTGVSSGGALADDAVRTNKKNKNREVTADDTAQSPGVGRKSHSQQEATGKSRDGLLMKAKSSMAGITSVSGEVDSDTGDGGSGTGTESGELLTVAEKRKSTLYKARTSGFEESVLQIKRRQELQGGVEVQLDAPVGPTSLIRSNALVSSKEVSASVS